MKSRPAKDNQDSRPEDEPKEIMAEKTKWLSTFNESFRDDDFTRTGVEIATKNRRLRVGWIGGHIPTMFYWGGLYSSTGSGVYQKQLRAWRLAISYYAHKP